MEEKLKIGERIVVDHTDGYPYNLLPVGCSFAHYCNVGNPYDGLSSIIIVVSDDSE